MKKYKRCSFRTEIAMEGAHDPECRRCMPWSEIESKENQEKIAMMQKLIMLRRNEKMCRSKVEVLLNASEEEIKVKGNGKILFCPRMKTRKNS